MLGRIRLIAAFIAFGIGVIDVVLVVRAASLTGIPDALSIGMTEALNDPGKTVFHVVILPIAIFTFLNGFPGTTIHQAKPQKSGLILSLVCLLAIVVLLAADSHSRPMGQDSLLRSPADCANSEQGKELFEIRKQARDLDEKNLEKKNGTLSVLKERYTRIDAMKSCRDKDLRHIWSNILTIVGVLFAGVLIWEVLVHVLLGGVDASRRYQTILTVGSILMLWVPLRAYSEWYLNFGILPLHSLLGIALITAAAGALVIVLAWLLELRSRVATKVMISILSGGSAAIGVVASVNEEKMEHLVSVLSTINWLEILIAYLILGVAIGSSAYLLVGRKPPSIE